MTGNSAISREKIFKIAQTLPAAPRVLAGLEDLLKDLNVELERVAELIKRDTALAAHLIRISNSIVYGGSGEIKVGTVEDAVSRVGYREIFRLVGLGTTTELANRALKFYNVPADSLRANMLYTALVCEALAEASGLNTRLAYTAGLMRTLGILVLDRVAELLTGVEPYDHEVHGSYALWEGRVFLFGNCEVAGMILSEWGFPAETIEAVRDHYLLREVDYDNKLACLLNLAGGIVAASGNALPGEYVYWEQTPRKLKILNLNTRMVSRANERAKAAFEAFRSHVDLGPLVEPSKKPESEDSSNFGAGIGVLRTDDESPEQLMSAAPSSASRWLHNGPADAGTQEDLPWWEQPFNHWPLAARALFLALAVVLAVGCSLAGSIGADSALSALHEHTVPLVRLHGITTTVSHLAAALFRGVPSVWLQCAAAFFALLYAAVFGLGAAAYRMLILNR